MHGFLSRKMSCSTPFLGSRLSLGAQEAMSPGFVAVELANIVLEAMPTVPTVTTP